MLAAAVALMLVICLLKLVFVTDVQADGNTVAFLAETKTKTLARTQP